MPKGCQPGMKPFKQEEDSQDRERKWPEKRWMKRQEEEEGWTFPLQQGAACVEGLMLAVTFCSLQDGFLVSLCVPIDIGVTGTVGLHSWPLKWSSPQTFLQPMEGFARCDHLTGGLQRSVGGFSAFELLSQCLHYKTEGPTWNKTNGSQGRLAWPPVCDVFMNAAQKMCNSFVPILWKFRAECHLL